MLDIVLTGGKVLDGAGNPWYAADVGVQDARIVAVGDLSAASALRKIDVGGRMVCPGFMDIHTHSDRSIMTNRNADSSVRQGVTTEVIGNCGFGFAPLSDRNRDRVQVRLSASGYPVAANWSTHGEYLEELDAGGVSENIVPLVGHGALRGAVAGWEERPVTGEELKEMEFQLCEAMESGAFGMSTGLEYRPMRATTQDELIALNRVVSRYGGIHASHQRNRDLEFEASSAEIIGACEAAGTRLQISHPFAKYGAPDGSWDRVREQVEAARTRGLDIGCDSLVYELNPGSMASVLPSWLFDEGDKVAAERLGDPAIRARIREDHKRYWLLVHDKRWDRLWLGPTINSNEYFFKSFEEIGRIRDRDPFDCYLDILQGEGEAIAGAPMWGLNMTREHFRELVVHPMFGLAADGSVISHERRQSASGTHPATFGWAVRTISEFARDKHWLTVEEAVRKMTSLPASRMRLSDRGLLRPGMFADVVVFDLDELRANATYDNPCQYPSGIQLVIVNGAITVENGEHTGVRAGRVLRRPT